MSIIEQLKDFCKSNNLTLEVDKWFNANAEKWHWRLCVKELLGRNIYGIANDINDAVNELYNNLLALKSLDKLQAK